jgi:chemosensory pili system protein ChpA (sensor histidine kinase/response regulator)
MAIKVLIIDNDYDFIEACKNFLEAAGYAVAYEQKELEAIAQIERVKPQVILLDLVMDTAQSGLIIAEKINADQRLRSIPIIFLTGYFTDARLLDKEKEIVAKWSNVRKVLDKPVKPAALLDALQKALAP